MKHWKLDCEDCNSLVIQNVLKY